MQEWNRLREHKHKVIEPVYMVDLEFRNIKTIYIVQDSTTSFQHLDEDRPTRIYIKLHLPAQCHKIYHSSHSPMLCRSPMNMTPDHLYLSYWNLNQVFFVNGTTSIQTLHEFKKIVKAKNPNIKIKTNTKGYFNHSETTETVYHMRDLNRTDEKC